MAVGLCGYAVVGVVAGAGADVALERWAVFAQVVPATS